jgi:folate-binding protein YgfZ
MWKFLTSSVALLIEGADARRYLHNRLSNSIRDLAVGSSIDAAALTAKGRVEALFFVSCLTDNSFLLCTDGGDSEYIRESLMRFAVADRVSCNDVSDKKVRVHIAGAVPEVLNPDTCVRRRRIADEGFDLTWLDTDAGSIRDQLEQLCGSEISDQEYFAARWACGVAIFPEEINADIILTESGMMSAVSFNKGCYVGQEVIERSDAIGRLPRKLERIRLSGQAQIACGDTVLKNDGSSIGKAISFGSDTAGLDVLIFALLGTGKYERGDTVSCGGVEGVVL